MTGSRTRTSAADTMLAAARIRADGMGRRKHDTLAKHDLRCADETEARVRVKLADMPGSTRLEEVGAGGELVPHDTSALDGYKPPPGVVDTVTDADYVAASASRDRLDWANDACALNAALDIADTIGARNSLERQMAHQAGALHRMGMKMAAQLNRSLERMASMIDHRALEVHNLHATRLAAAMARLTAAHTDVATALYRMRTGGRQTVVVQHLQQVQANRAVVAGKLVAGGRGRRNKRKVLDESD